MNGGKAVDVAVCRSIFTGELILCLISSLTLMISLVISCLQALQVLHCGHRWEISLPVASTSSNTRIVNVMWKAKLGCMTLRIEGAGF